MNVILDFLKNKNSYLDEKFENSLISTIIEDYSDYSLVKPNPIWFGLKVTGRCNFQCQHCWATLSKTQEPTLEQIFEALLKLKKMGVLHVTISGGEPFLRNDIVDILAYAKK